MSRAQRVKSIKLVPKSTEAEAPRILTTDEIAIRAYKIYLSRGDRPGTALDDWLQAERELSQSGK